MRKTRRTMSKVYHFTKVENLEAIIESGTIKRIDDDYTWFCKGYEEAIMFLHEVTCNPNSSRVQSDGTRVKSDAKIEDYVILELQPLHDSVSGWYDSNSTNTPYDSLVIAYKGDLKFKLIDTPFFGSEENRSKYEQSKA